MMRTVVLSALVFSLLVSSVAKTVLLADYLFNYDYISKVLCVNKDKPQMHCNGKCHLAKQLKEQEEKEKGQQRTQLQESDTECYVYQLELNRSSAMHEVGFANTTTLHCGYRVCPDHPPYSSLPVRG